MPLDAEEPGPPARQESRIAPEVDCPEVAARCRYVPIEPLARLAGDHVDHARDRVRSVERGRRSLDDFDAVKAIRGLPVHVEDASLDAPGSDDGIAVQQDQRLARVDALDLRFGTAARGTATRHDARLFRENVADPFVTRVEQLAPGDQIDLRDRVLEQFFFPRARNHDGLRQDRRREAQDDRLGTVAGKLHRFRRRFKACPDRREAVTARAQLQGERTLLVGPLG